MVLEEKIVMFFNAIVTNGDGGRVDKWLNGVVSQKPLDPGILTSSIHGRSAALGCQLGWHHLPSQAVALAIKPSTNIGEFVLLNY